MTDHDVSYAGESVWVDADNLRIAQIVDNLLVNALTCTPAGGSVKVSVGMHNRDAILRVEDSGSALDAASLPLSSMCLTRLVRDWIARARGSVRG